VTAVAGFLAGAAAGLAACELAAGLPGALAARTPRWARHVGAMVEAVVRAGREGRDPGALERRRLLIACSAVAFGAGLVTFGPLLGLALAAAGPVAIGRILDARRSRYRAAVEAGVPEMAVAIADALAGGRSLHSAIEEAAGRELPRGGDAAWRELPRGGDAAGRELPLAGGVGGAAGHELRRTAAELAAGAPTDDALEAMRRRVRSPGMDTLVAACLLQRRAGGDLARLLRDSARALEDQARLEGEVRSATAQARFTALIVVLLPLGGALLAELASPGWFAGLWSSFLTAWLVWIALFLQVLAAVLMNRLARVRW
jgi:tight adherence protein B